MSMIDLLFSFLLSKMGAGGYVSLDNFNISKQILALDNIVMTVSSCAFVRRHCYNQQIIESSLEEPQDFELKNSS